jgi:hypothetical protein
MYTVSNLDSVRELNSIPQSSVGAPCPVVVANDHRLLLAYYLEYREKDRGELDGCGLVEFERPYASMFGPPNDEAFSGHPLASRGLRPYGVFEVDHSSWLTTLERMNAVHPYHDSKSFQQLKHYIFTFHDSTFECIAKGFGFSEHRGDPWDVLAKATASQRFEQSRG